MKAVDKPHGSWKSTPFFNNYSLVLFALALVTNLVWLMFIHNKKHEFYYGPPSFHGEIAYNFYKANDVRVNRTRMGDHYYLYDRGLLPNYRMINHEKYKDEPLGFRPVCDTIGYGVLLGLLWKLTGTLSFRDVQIVQILIFSFLFFLLFQIALFVFRSSMAAFIGCLLTLFLYHPLVFFNVQIFRDIWAYYATVALLFGTLWFLWGKGSYSVFLITAIFASACQWIRANAVGFVALLILMLLAGAVFRKLPFQKALLSITTIVMVNVLLFWIPFTAYNRKAYGRSFVSPLGQSLVTGFGDAENSDGFEPSDAAVCKRIEDCYKARYGTAEFDESAFGYFWATFKKSPWLYLNGLLRRVFHALIPPFYSYMPDIEIFEGRWSSFRERSAFFIKHLTVKRVLHIIFNRIAIWLFLAIGYLGIFFAIRGLPMWPVLFLLSVIIAGWPLVLTCIQTRHLLPFYWPFGLFGGYFLYLMIPTFCKPFPSLSKRLRIDTY